MNDPTDLPTDRVPLGPDLKLFSGKGTALLDDLPPTRPSVSLPSPKPAEPPATVVRVPDPATDAPPPAPKPKWVKEAVLGLLQPSRRKSAVAVGMVSLAVGVVVVRMFTTAPPRTPPTAAEVTTTSAALASPTVPTPQQPADDGSNRPKAQVVPPVGPAVQPPGTGWTPPELPAVGPAAGSSIQQPALPAPTVPAALPVLPVADPLPTAAPSTADKHPPPKYDPTLPPALPLIAVGPEWYQWRNMVPPGDTPRVSAPQPDPSASLPTPRVDASVTQAGFAEQAPTIPTVPPTIPTIPTIPPSTVPAATTPVPAVSMPKDNPPPPKDNPADPPKLVTAPPVVAAPTTPPAGNLPSPGVLPPVVTNPPAVNDPKQSAFQERKQPDPAVSPQPTPVLEPAALPPTTFDINKPAGTAAVDPAAAPAPAAPAAKPTPFSFDVDLYTPKATDTFDGISKLHYGDPRYGGALEAFNADRGGRLGNGRDVEVPPVYVLRQARYARFIRASRPAADPPRDRDTNWGPASDLTPADGQRTFTVGARGATFRQVAATVYGDSRQWSRIWDLNPNYRADDELPAGTVVRLPADAPRRRPTTDQ